MNNIAIGGDAGQSITVVKDNVIIGSGSDSAYDHCILIGPHLTSDYEYQVKVGNSVYSKEKKMTPEEFVELKDVLTALVKSWMD